MRRPLAALVIVLAAAGCGGPWDAGRRTMERLLRPPSTEERRKVDRWLLCEECTDGELDSVVAMGDRAVPILEAALLDGPPEDRRENMREQIEAMWRGMRDTTAIQLPQYLAHFDSNYIASYQSRAAIGLDSIGSPAARSHLLEALRNDAGYRRDVRRVLGKVLGVRLSLVAGDSQHAVIDSFVRVDPTVLVVDSATGAGLEDVTVRFHVDSGGGQVLSSESRTDASGRASTRWRLGPGEDSINILRAVAAGRAVRFHARSHLPELRVVFVVQPRNARAGQPIMPPVRIEVHDAWGVTQTQINQAVTVTVAGTGISSVYRVVNGAAQLGGFSIPNAGANLTLVAQVPGAKAVGSAPFDIAP